MLNLSVTLIALLTFVAIVVFICFIAYRKADWLEAFIERKFRRTTSLHIPEQREH